LALAHSGEDRDIERTAHVFLAKTYFRMKQPNKARLHEQWLTGQ